MEVKRIIKIIGLSIIGFFLVILIKNNVTVKDDETVANDSGGFNLDINSDLVRKLYSSLNLELIGNTCYREECLWNSSYQFLYYDFREYRKTLNDAEKLYIAFNSLYRKKNYTSIDGENKKVKLTFTKADVIAELSGLFAVADFADFDNLFDVSTTCGITDYLYTGDRYVLTVDKCDNVDKRAYANLIGAEKIGNYIKIDVEVFLAQLETKAARDLLSTYILKDFHNAETSIHVGFEELENNLETIFQNNDFSVYTFTFELQNDEYYLKDISVQAI